MDLNDKRVLVVGLGKSGVASALFLKASGARVTVSDAKSRRPAARRNSALLDHGIAVETGGHGERTFQEQDLIVVSPGRSCGCAAAGAGAGLGEPVIGEIELAAAVSAGADRCHYRLERQDHDHHADW